MRIQLETAKLAREKGYSIYNDYRYDRNGKITETPSIKEILRDGFWLELKQPNFIFASLQSELQAWLRDIHETYITIDYDCYLFNVRIMKIGMEEDIKLISYLNEPNSYCFYTYEQALEEALIQSLKLIKN